MTEIEQLNANIREAEQAAKDAGHDAAQAETEYQKVIATGDIAAADSALQRQAEAERMQKIQSDRAQALEAGRRQAEAADYGPAADEAVERARIAVEAEAQALNEFAQAVERLADLSEAGRRAVERADAAIREAHEASAKAHRPRPQLGRENIESLGGRLHALAKVAPQNETSIGNLMRIPA